MFARASEQFYNWAAVVFIAWVCVAMEWRESVQ